MKTIRQRSGGAVTDALEEIIKQGSARWGAHAGEPSGRAGSLVGGILQEILSPAFVNYIDARSLLQKLGGQDGDRVGAFIKSLPDAQRDGGAATTALFLAVTTTWRPNDVRFEWQQAQQDGDGLGAWAIHIAKDSALEKLFSKFVKSKAVEAAGGVVKKGGASLVAGILTKLGLSAAVDVILTMIATPVATAIKWAVQAAIWLGGYIWRPISSFLGKLTRGKIMQLGAVQGAIKQTVENLLGPRPPTPKQWYEQDWVVIISVIAVAILLPWFGVIIVTPRDSALFMAGQFTGTEESFINEAVEQPDLSRVAPECLSNNFPMPSAEGVRTTIVNGRSYAFPIAPYNRTYHTCGHHDGLDATDIGIIGVNTDEPLAGLAVVAYTSGVISMTRMDDPKGGKYVILRGDDGKSYYYAHNCALYVGQGDRVSAGQVIAASGDTGSAATTPEHLHFAISGAGESFYSGGDACPAYDFEQKFGLGKCSASQLCPSKKD